MNLRELVNDDMAAIYTTYTNNVFSLGNLEILNVKVVKQLLGDRLEYKYDDIHQIVKGKARFMGFRKFHRLVNRLIKREAIKSYNVSPYFDMVLSKIALKDIGSFTIIESPKAISSIYKDTSINSCLNGISEEVCEFYNRANMVLLYYVNIYISYRCLAVQSYGELYITAVYSSDNTLSTYIRDGLIKGGLKGIEDLTTNRTVDIIGLSTLPYVDLQDLYIHKCKDKAILTNTYLPNGFTDYVKAGTSTYIEVNEIDYEQTGSNDPSMDHYYLNDLMDLDMLGLD